MKNKYYLARFISEEYGIPIEYADNLIDGSFEIPEDPRDLSFCSDFISSNKKHETVNIGIREKAYEINNFIENKLSTKNYLKINIIIMVLQCQKKKNISIDMR